MCGRPEVPPLSDGAAFDPSTGAWRRIADAPRGLEVVDRSGGASAAVGRAVYFLASPGHGDRGRVPPALAYSVDRDRWEVLPQPPLRESRPRCRGSGYSIAAAGNRLVAYASSDEGAVMRGLVYDPRSSTWERLPTDPLPRSFDRSMTWSGDKLILFAKPIARARDSDRPTLVRAAALDFEAGSWRLLPQSDVLDMEATGRWFDVGGRVVNPALGRSDGGTVGHWGRSYPEGGILDPNAREWLGLPSRPDRSEGYPVGGGVMTETGGHYYDYRGWILDMTADRWIPIPPLDPGAEVTNRTVLSAGGEMFAFGGARWGRVNGASGLINEAWIWSPASGGSFGEG